MTDPRNYLEENYSKKRKVTMQGLEGRRSLLSKFKVKRTLKLGVQ
jgi:hypothetical protein